MVSLITWNCNMAFRKKYARVLPYDPDVLVIQECENPAIRGDWSAFSDWEWIGENEHKGLGIFTRNSLSIESIELVSSDFQYVLPVRLSNGLTMFGVWAMNDTENFERRYIGQVYAALRYCRDHLGSNTIVAGDFNWNRIWDASPKYPLCGNLSDTVDILNEAGLISAYHTADGSDFGDEDHPTFFMHKQRDRPYHIDYVFVPEWMVGADLRCTVGGYDEWIDASDHVPIVVEVSEA